MAYENWPTEVAKRVKLLIPHDYEPYKVDKPGKCFVQLSVEKKCLLIISEDSGDTIDVIDPRDIVGASIEIDVLESPGNLRSSVKRQESLDLPDPSKEQQRDYNEPLDRLNDTQGSATMKIYAYPRVHPDEKVRLSSCGFTKKTKPNLGYPSQNDDIDVTKFGPRSPRHRHFQVEPAEDLSELSTLVDAIRKLSRPGANDDRLLVIVNPFSGTKKGRIVFKNVVAPMFEQAGIVYDHLMTGYANHAMERMKEQEKDSSITDVSKYDGIVAIGGDGIIHEILQGIRERSDCDEILSKLKLGVIGSGTSNGLSKSLVHASKEQATPIDNAFLIAKGITTSLDLSRYETKSASYLSFLTFSWAIIADIDIESEAIRFVGYLRMDLWGAWRTLFLRKYRARFSYLPPTNGKVVTRCPPLEESIPNDGIWVTCEDDFIMFWASQVTHAAESTFQTPQCKPDDGVFEILIIRGKVSRIRLAMILITLDGGGHANMPGVEFIRCSAYRLEPITPGSFNDLDGEVIEAGPIQGHVLPSAIEVYCNPAR